MLYVLEKWRRLYLQVIFEKNFAVFLEAMINFSIFLMNREEKMETPQNLQLNYLVLAPLTVTILLFSL